MDKLKRSWRELNYEQKVLKYFYPNKFKVENYEKGNEDYKFWHGKFIKEQFKKNYEHLLLINDGHSPPPKEGYENSTFAIISTPLLSQPVHELKPFSRKKPKIKYETLDDVGSEIRIFVNMRTEVEIHHEDGKGYTYAVLSQLYPRSWGKMYLYENQMNKCIIEIM
jgi:hypothetical protein